MRNPLFATLLIVAVVIFSTLCAGAAEPAAQKSFESPRAAGEAFLKALEANDLEAIRSMLTPKLRVYVDKSPQAFESVTLVNWLKKRGKGLTINGTSEVQQSGPNEWKSGVWMSFKGEGDTVWNTTLSVYCYSKDHKEWYVHP